MILFTWTLSQRNLIYTNIFVSANSWLKSKSILLLFLHVRRSSFTIQILQINFLRSGWSFWWRFSPSFEKVFHYVVIIGRTLKLTVKSLRDFCVASYFNFVHGSWTFVWLCFWKPLLKLHNHRSKTRSNASHSLYRSYQLYQPH